MLAANPKPPSIRARVIKDGNSVAVRLPASLGLKPGEEVVLEIRRVTEWPDGFFDLEPSPEFPMPERTRPAAREARKKRLFEEDKERP
jgi:antitoxin component of MazEF toxin-antitoxin module